MEDVIGARGDPALFDRFLADWQTVLARRTRTAVEAFAAVDGLAGLVLAGSVGRGEPWPLSDIDFLVVYDDGRTAEAGQEVERRRLAILDGWAREGWWTGLDLGRLVFERREVEAMLDGREMAALLADDRWFHSVSKGYRGRAAHDLDGLAAALAAWASEHRFDPEVVALRLARWRREAEEALARARTGLHEEDPLAATIALRRGTAMLAAWLIERWGEHDSSFGRTSTRLERAARARGQTALVDELHALTDLDDPAVGRRMAAAPAWVRERHDRSYRARRRVGEEVTGVQDARDVLRVSTHYELERLVLDLNGLEPVPAYLTLPRAARGRVPVVLYNHAHGGDYVLGKDELLDGRAALQRPPYAEALAARGYAALAIDAWLFGERRGRTESELFKLMLWRGQVLWGMMVYDSLRAIDYLTTRADVDPDRIATLGLSMGSTMAWWVAPLDERVRVCVDLCCLTDFEALIETRHLDGHGVYYYVPGLLKRFTTARINALIAPRPHLSLAGTLDRLTPPAGLDRVDAELRRVYAEAGAPEAWRLVRYETGHFETAAGRAEVLAFLERHLG